MSNQLTEQESGAVPDWARKASTGAAFGNIDSSDLKPPRLKILAGQSPEVTDGVPGAIPGNFWMTLVSLNLGPQVTGTPILMRKSYHVWAPRGGTVNGSPADSKAPLATAPDGVRWDNPNQTWKIKFQGNPREYTWAIKNLVTENRTNKFGTSMPEDPKSKPIATLTYDVLWMIDIPATGKKQMAVFTNSRTGIAPTQNWMSGMAMMGVDPFYQRYTIRAEKRTGPTGDPYFTYSYQFMGGIKDPIEGAAMKALYDQYRKTGFVTDLMDEGEDIRTERHTEGGPRDFGGREDDKEDIPF